MSFMGSEATTRPPAASVRSATGRTSSVSSPTGAPMTSSSPAWNSVVDTVHSAGQRMSQMFTVAEDAAAVQEGGIVRKLQTWWDDATGYVQDAGQSVQSTIAELSAPAPVPNDPLQPIRDDCKAYFSLLDSLRTEVLNFSLMIDSIRRPGSADHDALSEQIRLMGDSALYGQYAAYVDIHRAFSTSETLTNAREAIGRLLADIQVESEKVGGLQTRFRRRDKIHGTISESQGKLSKRKEKHRGSTVRGSIDPRVMQEIFEITTGMEEARKEFRVASDAIVERANEILVNKGVTFQRLLATLVDIQRQVFESGTTLGTSLAQLSKKFVATKAVRYEAYAKAPESDAEAEDERMDAQQTKPATVEARKSMSGRSLSSPIKSPFLAQR